MAKLYIDNIEYNITDGMQIAETAEAAGIPFSCNNGVCGTCQIIIKEGEENLNEINQEEKDLAMDRTHRLACQCRINSGIVKITF